MFTCSFSEWSARELVPVGTWLDCILYIREYLSSAKAVSHRSDYSSLLLSLDLDIAIGINSHIYGIERSRSNKAIVKPFVYAHACRNREYQRKTYCEWALVCKECSHPCDRARCVGESEFYLLLIILEVGNIKLIPFSIVSRNSSTISPIEVGSVVATKIVSVIKLESEEQWLVGSYLNIVLRNILIQEFIQDMLWDRCEQCSNIEPSRNSYSKLSKDIVVAVKCECECDVSSLLAFVLECKLRQHTKAINEFICNTIPSRARVLVKLFTFLDSSSVFASWVESYFNEFRLELNSSCRGNREVSVLDFRSCEEVSIDHFLYGETSRHWANHWDRCARAAEHEFAGNKSHL